MTNSEITKDDIIFYKDVEGETYQIGIFVEDAEAEQLKQKILTALRLLDGMEKSIVDLCRYDMTVYSETGTVYRVLKSLLTQAKGEKK